MTYTFATVIVTTAVAANLKELSRRLDKSHCDGMFTSPLSATGALPATHYVSSGWVPAPYLNAVTSPTRLFNLGKAAWEADGDVFPFTQAQVTNALSKCTLSDGTFNGQPESPHAMIARLGLQMVISE
jgi:hypothetical protein